MATSLGSWLLVTSIAICAPNTNTCRIARIAKNRTATVKFRRAKSRCRPFSRYHADTESTSAEPIIHDATQTCARRGRNDGVNITALNESITACDPHCVVVVE